MSAGRVIVYGGKGALGAACVSHFKSNNYVSIVNLQIYFLKQIKPCIFL